MANKFLLAGSAYFVNEVRSALSSLAPEVDVAGTFRDLKLKSKNKDSSIILFDEDSYSYDKAAIDVLRRSGKKFVIFSSDRSRESVLAARRAGAYDYIIKPYNLRELNLRLNAAREGRNKVSCIGGGTGLFNLLMGLKELPDVLATSIVSMTDDGGSSGRLRESFGVLPPGDVRRSLVALSNAPQVMNDIITYRFKKANCFIGHNFGNILLTVLSDITGSMPDAVKTLGDVLNIRGMVLPVSTTISKLCARFENGKIIRGESNIDLCKGRSCEKRIRKCWHEPDSAADINAFSSIMNADFVIIGPGDLYTSVITNLIIKDIRYAVTNTNAKKIYICNLMTKPGETTGFNAAMHIKEIIKYLKEDCLDYVVISDNSDLPGESVLKYLKKKQVPVHMGDAAKLRKFTKAKIIVADVSHKTELIRHDSRKLASIIDGIIHKERNA